MLTPLFSGVRTVLYPTPLHYGIIPEFIYNTNATIFFATNSFLNGYARKAHTYDFYALRYVFAGAEKASNRPRRNSGTSGLASASSRAMARRKPRRRSP